MIVRFKWIKVRSIVVHVFSLICCNAWFLPFFNMFLHHLSFWSIQFTKHLSELFITSCRLGHWQFHIHWISFGHRYLLILVQSIDQKLLIILFNAYWNFLNLVLKCLSWAILNTALTYTWVVSSISNLPRCQRRRVSSAQDAILSYDPWTTCCVSCWIPLLSQSSEETLWSGRNFLSISAGSQFFSLIWVREQLIINATMSSLPGSI